MSDWRKSAACAGYDPALWFPGNSQLMRREAIHICHTCPVMMQCRKYAETNKSTQFLFNGRNIFVERSICRNP